MFEEYGLQNLRTGGKIIGGLADDANLPDKIPDLDRSKFNEMPSCELCDRDFNKLKRIDRHHCRKCYRSVCDKCSMSRRKLSKACKDPHRVCDYCDTQLSNFKLEQNQLTILKAQEEQMEMYKTQLELLDNQKDLEKTENEKIEAKLKEFLKKELEKKANLEEEVKTLEDRTTNLSMTRTELFKQLTALERLLDTKKEDRNDLRSKVLVKQTQLDEKQRELDEREAEVKQLINQLRDAKQRQEASKNPLAGDVLDNQRRYNDGN